MSFNRITALERPLGGITRLNFRSKKISITSIRNENSDELDRGFVAVWLLEPKFSRTKLWKLDKDAELK